MRFQVSLFEASLLLSAIYTTGVEADRSSDLGLNPSNLRLNGIAFGAIPAFKERSNPNTPLEINSKLPRPISIMGDYVELDTNAEGLKKIDWHLDTILNLPGKPVYQIALMPNHGLLSVSPLVINRIAAKMAEINRNNITVWLRFGHEMNGQWYNWGLNPWLFKEKWRALAVAVHREAPDTYMMWAPNARFGKSVHSTKGGYTQYWPGREYVDIAALSYYHFGGSRRRNLAPKEDQALEKIQEFAKLYGSAGAGKPIVLAETSAPYTRLISTKQPERGGATEREIKITWLKQLFSRNMKELVPDLKAISWFEIIKSETAPGRRDAKSEDFRLLVGNKRVSEEARYYMSETMSNQEKR
ncbi:hypothetical protein MJO28_005213 [Puccinia striiformis f. sp. tritici]|uniref:Uncharacterized protein n=1 Tax=Puccinia striiformis f. sp. tritici TaxID=168172 RepID=A0ACC0EJL9_9BASI|nr:hypothetical protein Pst134EA_009387 [Puccinia striiformis f. sp. tritici]KAI9622881.1 hypothetical protein H4Q26_014820 [Puccinia striiformis f. sp. tritici PST-130]KAH9458150.1 hypothetical protein Pst134EB_010452 [Puccinia striiformis f. sp. tritici]KAH9468856.1 hypothetical protein Pst134EA_009387 [Puccinia striiformis f. sp. tritici]KAI7954813.1 hypothetical protein MJO28_005213 [Puccinia striiformis f. sp. tritici]KAI7960201.1 hypothetical protein MJO29_005269 [Puccinia striiformis f.